VSEWFHVTSSLNRESIQAHGLDWRYMETAGGIAGSREPEQQGCFLCRGTSDVDWFIQMNNTGGPVDVWAVAGVDEASLRESPEGYLYETRPIPPSRLTLVRRDIDPVDVTTLETGRDAPMGGMSVTFRPGYKPGQR
jgi:hypothetical protein